LRAKAQCAQDAPDLGLAVFDPVQTFDQHAGPFECPPISAKAVFRRLLQDGAAQRFELVCIEFGRTASQTHFA